MGVVLMRGHQKECGFPDQNDLRAAPALTRTDAGKTTQGQTKKPGFPGPGATLTVRKGYTTGSGLSSPQTPYIVSLTRKR